MVYSPCIVIPVLLWVYKRFLEPIRYPFISPFINTFWTKKAVQETGTSDQKSSTGVGLPTRKNPSIKCNTRDIIHT
uniref:CR032 protein n=1 Tax=Sphaeramia orbicularis TaxID=375764 RepID=A0A672YAL5_9TELE